MHTAIIKTLEERQRQIHEEGFTAARDDQNSSGELSEAAGAYALATSDMLGGIFRSTRHAPTDWPSSWDASWWKLSTDPKRNIIKAMALLAAEYDRIERAEAPADLTPAGGERWSADDEWQSSIYDDLQEVIEDRELEVGATVYTGTRKQARATDFTHNLDERVIESMQLQAEDDAGEVAEDYPSVTEPQTQTLQILIEAWATQYCTPDFYTIADVKPHTITPEDLQAANQ